MSRIQSLTRWVVAQVVAASKLLLRIIDGRFRRTPPLVNQNPLAFGKTSETPAEHIRNALSILHLTAATVSASQCVIVPLEDWKAAWALLSTAVAKLERSPVAVPASLTLDEPAAFVPVSRTTSPPTRNVTTNERLRAINSARDSERQRAYFGPQLS